MYSALAPEKAAEIVNSPDFQSFFDRSSRMVERALNQKYDVTINYAEADGEEE